MPKVKFTLKMVFLYTILLLNSGCFGLPFFRNIPIIGDLFAGDNTDSVGTNQNQLDTDLETVKQVIPETGDQIMILNPQNNESFLVTFGQVYDSASGKSCSYYYKADTVNNNNPAGLTCIENNKWVDVPLIINPKKIEELHYLDVQ